MGMLRRLLALLLLLLLLLGLASAHAEGAQIDWALVDGPPYHLRGVSGDGPARSVEELGDGITDRLVAQLAQALPQYRHRLVWLSRQAMWRQIRAGQPLCYPDAFRSEERRRVAWFSEVSPGVPQVLLLRPGLHKGATRLSLQSLLQDARLHGMFEKQRSYGPRLDPLLAIPGEGRAQQWQAMPNGPQLLRMLEHGRMDYLIEFATAVQHHREQLQPPPQFGLARITEEEVPPPTAVACTRSDWGRAVIVDIDAAIRRISAQSEGGAALLRWLPPELRRSEAARIERYYRERAGRSAIE